MTHVVGLPLLKIQLSPSIYFCLHSSSVILLCLLAFLVAELLDQVPLGSKVLSFALPILFCNSRTRRKCEHIPRWVVIMFCLDPRDALRRSLVLVGCRTCWLLRGLMSWLLKGMWNTRPSVIHENAHSRTRRMMWSWRWLLCRIDWVLMRQGFACRISLPSGRWLCGETAL